MSPVALSFDFNQNSTHSYEQYHHKFKIDARSSDNNSTLFYNSSLKDIPLKSESDFDNTRSSLLNNSNINSTSNKMDTQGPGLSSLFEVPKMDNFVDIFSICCSIAMIFGGIIPYVPQYLKIKSSMSSDGFSTYVCLTLLIANILRIMFWFGHRFETPLLIQSFVIIIGMLAMMEICVRTKDKNSSFMISTIGGSSSTQSNRRRRSLIGKLFSKSDCTDYGPIDESLPIYSVLASSSSSYRLSQSFSSCTSQNEVKSSESQVVDSQLPIQELNNSEHQQQNYQESSYQFQNDHHLLQSQQQSQQVSCDLPIVVSYSNELQQCREIETSQRPSDYQDCCQVQHGRNLNKCLNLNNFWEWDDLFSYVKFLSLFTFIFGILTYFLADNYLYVESIGFLALFTESMLGMPQLLRNYAKKSTRGMSVEMVAMWLSGDLFKTLYYFIKNAPSQFYKCGSIQIVIDVLILIQVICYRRPGVSYRKLPKST